MLVFIRIYNGVIQDWFIADSLEHAIRLAQARNEFGLAGACYIDPPPSGKHLMPNNWVMLVK